MLCCSAVIARSDCSQYTLNRRSEVDLNGGGGGGGGGVSPCEPECVFEDVFLVPGKLLLPLPQLLL